MIRVMGSQHTSVQAVIRAYYVQHISHRQVGNWKRRGRTPSRTESQRQRHLTPQRSSSGPAYDKGTRAWSPAETPPFSATQSRTATRRSSAARQTYQMRVTAVRSSAESPLASIGLGAAERTTTTLTRKTCSGSAAGALRRAAHRCLASSTDCCASATVRMQTRRESQGLAGGRQALSPRTQSSRASRARSRRARLAGVV